MLVPRECFATTSRRIACNVAPLLVCSALKYTVGPMFVHASLAPVDCPSHAASSWLKKATDRAHESSVSVSSKPSV